MFRILTIAALAAALGCVSPGVADAAGIKGTTKGKTVMAPPKAVHPISRDDKNVATTDDIAFLSSSAIITEAAKAFPAYSFVFAGAASGVGSKFTPIAPETFTISDYAPWVVTSPDVKSPGGTVYNRGVVDRDAGGASIIINYLPMLGDPTSVNFLQAYTVNFNGKGTSKGTMDNGSAGAVPYYNKTGAAGTDSNDDATVPLVASTTKPAWLLDTPFLCESGFSAGGMGCPATTAANDETFTSYVDRFVTFIEADMAYTDPDTMVTKTYNVLFGGLSWGFTWTATDVPEPQVWALLVLGFFGLGSGLRRRRDAGAGLSAWSRRAKPHAA
jgi:hypothetical protein